MPRRARIWETSLKVLFRDSPWVSSIFSMSMSIITASMAPVSSLDHDERSAAILLEMSRHAAAYTQPNPQSGTGAPCLPKSGTPHRVNSSICIGNIPYSVTRSSIIYNYSALVVYCLYVHTVSSMKFLSRGGSCQHLN